MELGQGAVEGKQAVLGGPHGVVGGTLGRGLHVLPLRPLSPGRAPPGTSLGTCHGSSPRSRWEITSGLQTGGPACGEEAAWPCVLRLSRTSR